MEPSEHVDVGGSSFVPTNASSDVSPNPESVTTEPIPSEYQKYVSPDASVDVSTATKSISPEDTHCVSPDFSDPIPSKETSDGPIPDISFSSTPSTRKKTVAKKRKASKGESPKDSTFIDFDSDDENPVV